MLGTKAKNKFEKYFFNLMNNSVYAKTLENMSNHKQFKLATNEKNYTKYIMNLILKVH